jgi:hypothetical protein
MSEVRHARQGVRGRDLVLSSALHLVVRLHGFSAVVCVVPCGVEWSGVEWICLYMCACMSEGIRYMCMCVTAM